MFLLPERARLSFIVYRISNPATPGAHCTLFGHLETSAPGKQKLVSLAVFDRQTKMAQTLAMPVVPSLSAICNGLKNTSLSSSISPPFSNPPKVALPFLFLL